MWSRNESAIGGGFVLPAHDHLACAGAGGGSGGGGQGGDRRRRTMVGVGRPGKVQWQLAGSFYLLSQRDHQATMEATGFGVAFGARLGGEPQTPHRPVPDYHAGGARRRIRDDSV